MSARQPAKNQSIFQVRRASPEPILRSLNSGHFSKEKKDMSDSKQQRKSTITIPLLKGAENDIKLVLKLMQDKRISFWYKLLPVFGVIYLIDPVDLAPGPVDDVIVMYICYWLFVYVLSPSDIVQYYRDIISGKIKEPTKVDPNNPHKANSDDDVIDGEFHDVP
jgi:hypothetical protein